MASSLIKTPHPVTLEGQEHIPVHLIPGESLYALLARTLGDQLNGELWNVSVAGVEIPREQWHDCYPKDGQVIECVGDVGRSALMMIAVVALTIWTGGMFAAVAAGGGIAGLGTVASYAAIAGIQMAGSLLINKVLGPKPPGSPDTTQGPQAYALTSTNNQARQHGAVPILFGQMRVAPDLLSQTYNFFDADDMYLAMHVSWGIGVGRIAALRNGDTLMSSFDDNVKQWNAGFSGMPQDDIPLFGNADTQPGGSLQNDAETLLEVERTTSVDTVRVLVNISGNLYGVTRKGKLSMNQESILGEYRPVGSGGGWIQMMNRPLQNDDRRTLRFTLPFDFPEPGQYDVRIRRQGRQSTGDGDVCNMNVDTIVSVQQDTSTYDGIARTGLTLRANERLTGTPSEVNATAIASPIPVWNGTSWVTEETSNPGAHMLKYLRGYYSPTGQLIAGVGLEDDDIDVPAFQAFMLHCAREKFEYNYWLAADRDHLTVLNSIAGAAMGQFTDSNGRYSVVWVAEDQAIDGTINMARIKRGTFSVDYSLIATADGVVARYWDAALDKEALLRVPMPGVTTMLSPANITLEGVTSEEQAALLARYYLGQSLYQFKDISFGTSLENLTFRRLSLLQMQHDMTQWGYGGVILKAEAVGNRIQFTLDEPVPAPEAGKQAWIGIRVPGHRAAAVLKVRPFQGTSNVLTLDEVWPANLPLPGDKSDNPAHDTIWIYDFKETPGLTVRVTNIGRAADRSATVSVVQESAEFWNYVRTGEYIPADSGSLLRTRPVINAIEVSEQQEVTGDVAQDQLMVSFDVEGPYDRARVYTAEPGGELRLRAETVTRNAVFNIAGPGRYTITVIPYNAQGLRGAGKSVIFDTKDAGMPPVLVDYFQVEQVSGGVRFYNWGFYPDTIQSADFVGVELRYMPGEDIAEYDWDEMLPIGETGYHTVPFEAVVPTSGKYIFACRSRNASGVLSEDAKVIAKELGANLGEVIEKIRDDNEKSFEEILEEVKKTQDDLLEEARIREEQILAEASTREEQVVQLEQGIANNVQALLNEKLEREAAISAEATIRQSADESLAYQISQISAGTGDQFDSAKIWYFDTDAEGWTGVAVDGWLKPTGPTTQSPDGLGIDSTAYRYLKMRVRRTGAPTGLTLGYTLADGTEGSLPLPQPAWDDRGIGTVDASDIEWPGTLQQIRLTGSGVTAQDFYEYDWIAVGRPTPGASVAMVQDETRARITADAVEAARRETLAVQLRGDYEGTDAAQLTTGLMYSEKTLRIEGDEILGQRIDTMQVSVDGNRAAITEEAQVRASEDAALAAQITRLNSDLDGKADATVVQDLTTRVEETETGLQAVSTSVLKLDAQLYGPHAGDEDGYAGDEDVYAGTLTAYSAMATEAHALANRIDRVSVQFGEFQGVVRQQIEVIATEVSAQAVSIEQLKVEMGDKASAQTVTTLTARVEQIGNTTNANAESIQRVEAQVAGKADGSVVQQMQVEISSTTGQVAQINARYFLSVQANGLVGGMYIGNNGQVVNARFAADKFTIESPSGSGQRFEYSNNSIRIYDANNRMRVRLGVF